MLKLPLRVIQKPINQKDQLLGEAIALRADLEKLAVAESQMSREYLRPILLIQAPRVDACEPLRAELVANYGLSADWIKISVGNLDELKDVKDIASPDCLVRVIITVQKLREGWDCPFAYVLCSLRETRSPSAIEQIVGRILRQPGAKLKRHPELNCSYAFSVSDSLMEVLAELREALEGNGFTSAEVAGLVQPRIQGTLFAPKPETVEFDADEINVSKAEAVVSGLAGKAVFDPDKREITIRVPLEKGETEKLAACLKSPEAKTKIRDAAKAVSESDKAFGGTGEGRTPTPYERGVEFAVPRLAVRENGHLFEFEETYLLERIWKLGDKDAALPAAYNPLLRDAGRTGTVDIGKRGRVETQVAETDFVAELHQQVQLFNTESDWSREELIAWLDSRIPHLDISEIESARFLAKVLNGLEAKYELESFDELVRDRFRLKDEIEEAIDRHRTAERLEAFKSFLFGVDSALAVDPSLSFNFQRMSYEPSWTYQGPFQFKKHYFGKPGELSYKTSAGRITEEFACAEHLDGFLAIECWVRNLAKKPSSFRLQTSKNWFYPDFVCKLADGRSLVVEYKGKHLFADAQEKRDVGAIWAKRSGGRCLFVMPTDSDFAAIEKAVALR